MKKIICGKENIETFRSELKATLPGFYDLAKQLYSSGLIDGLRGATLEIGPFTEQPIINPPGIPAKERTCKECAHWQRDNIGLGSGIGQCLLNVKPSQLKWPGIIACNQFSEAVCR